MRHRLLTSAAVLLLLTASAAPASAAITAERVIHLDAMQWHPFANETYLAYTSNSLGRPGHWDAFARDRVTGAQTRLNGAGTQAYTGGFDPGTNVAIFQEAEASGSTIYLLDLDTDLRSKAPGVNSSRWEWGPRISTSFISFVRNVRVNGRDFHKLYLHDRTSGTTQTMASYRTDRVWGLTNGSVGDRYATWSWCDASSCYVGVYDAETRARRILDAPRDRPQYGPTIDEATGMLYYIRSGFGCGLAVALFREPVDGSGVPVKIGALPDGIDADHLSVAPNPDTLATDLLFSRLPCRKNADIDIWAFPGVSA